MSRYYILDGHTPVAADLMTWARWFETADAGRRVAITELPGGVRVSTVFLGINENWQDLGPPALFETLIVGGGHDGEEHRYATWAEAERGHRRLVRRVRAKTPVPEGA